MLQPPDAQPATPGDRARPQQRPHGRAAGILGSPASPRWVRRLFVLPDAEMQSSAILSAEWDSELGTRRSCPPQEPLAETRNREIRGEERMCRVLQQSPPVLACCCVQKGTRPATRSLHSPDAEIGRRLPTSPEHWSSHAVAPAAPDSSRWSADTAKGHRPMRGVRRSLPPSARQRAA